MHPSDHAQSRSTSRRNFLNATVATIAAAPVTCHSFAFGADQQVNLGVIGTGMRGKYLIANLPAAFRVTALCDCSLNQVESARQPTGRFTKTLGAFAKGDGRNCAVYQDYRVMLAKQPFDAIVIATPDHHHAQAAILAMGAGAHVYVEKPLAVDINEGRAIVNAARKYNRVVQVGSQQRTDRSRASISDRLSLGKHRTLAVSLRPMESNDGEIRGRRPGQLAAKPSQAGRI